MFISAHVIAALLGVICGSAMIAMLIFIPIILKKRAQKKGSEYTPNDFMPQELAHSFLAIMLTFIFASVAIYVFHLIAPDYLVWFGVTMLVWYLAGFTFYAMQKIVKERKPLEK